MGNVNSINTNNNENECLICWDALTNGNNMTFECGHKFHSKCIFRWMTDNTGCPYCRKELR